jgi:dynein heavy chain
VFQGLWVLLRNGHSAPHLLSSLESIFTEYVHNDGQVDPQFRCWVTAEGTPSIPVRLLQASVKVMVDIPKVSHFLGVHCVLEVYF